MSPSENLGDWVIRLLDRQISEADRALRRLRAKPHSRKRIHAARKKLARLLASANDFRSCIGDEAIPYDRIRALHKRLGRVRDADVHLQRLRAYRKGAATIGRAEQQSARSRIREQRSKARKKLAALMKTPCIRASG